VVTRRGRGKTVCARGAWVALLGGPSTSPLGTQVDMHLRIRKVIAGLIAPLVLALMIIGTRPVGEPVTWPFVLFACVLAHMLYWPAAVATHAVGARLNQASPPRLVLLMACFSAILSLLCAIPFVYFHLPDSSYGWHDVARDAGDQSVAGAGAFILFSVIVNGVTWVPNNRWRGP
jgi:hypothetical protein